MPNELYHYGIKGMKWGVRRKRESLGSRLKARYRLNGDPEKELREVEGADPSKALAKASTGSKGQYKPNQTDVTSFGKGGAQRIAN